MIATARTLSRPGVARAARSGLPASVSRPLTVSARAFKQDEAPKAADAPAEQQQHAVARPEAAAVARAPVMRLPSLFHDMQREMDAMSRMFGLWDDDLFAPFSRAPALLQHNATAPALPRMRLATDIAESDKAFTITADCPGMSKEDIKLSVLENTLTITGERKEEKREGGEGCTPLRFERSWGSFKRSFVLPKNAGVDGISAAAKDGVLTVTVPKLPEEEPKAKEIAVE